MSALARQGERDRHSWRSWVGGALALWLVLPIVPLAIWSFAKGWFFPDLLPRRWSLDAWRYAASDTAGVLDSLWLTTAVALVVTALCVVIGVPAGRALGMYEFRGKRLVQLLVLAPTIVPGIAVVLGIHSVFIGMGLTNSPAGVVLVHLVPALPYMVLVMAGIFANFDPAYEEQARSLGAGPWAAFVNVTLPLIMPGLAVGAMFTFLVSWSQYVLTLVVGGGRVVTLPLLLFSFATSGRNDIAGAIGLVYILPGILIVALTSRQLARGAVAAGRA